MPLEAPLSIAQHVKPTALWLGYLIPELVLPFVIAGAHDAGT